MEHINVINQILAADHKAKAIAESAIAEQNRLHEDIDREREKLQDAYMEHARGQVEAAAARERAMSDRMIAELDEKLHRDLERVDRQLVDRRAELAEKMFSMIVGDGGC